MHLSLDATGGKIVAAGLSAQLLCPRRFFIKNYTHVDKYTHRDRRVLAGQHIFSPSRPLCSFNFQINEAGESFVKTMFQITRNVIITLDFKLIGFSCRFKDFASL
jgi:hypothetical protein